MDGERGKIWVRCGKAEPQLWGVGHWVGHSRKMVGEFVFTTGMVGYTETLTDPSYAGQIVVFAYPLIGNYGVGTAVAPDGYPAIGFESRKIQAAGAVVGWASPDYSHWSAQTGLTQWMDQQGVALLASVDTRALIQWMREMRRVERAPVLAHVHASETAPQEWRDPGQELIWPQVSVSQPEKISGMPDAPTVAVLDCGVKWNLVRQLQDSGVSIWLLPWDTDLAEWIEKHPEVKGILLSNGPGDPSLATSAVQNVRKFLSSQRAQQTPLLGVCLGHQILALASGARTERMEYGHRSHNQPVIEVSREVVRGESFQNEAKVGSLLGTRGWLTSQNHGFVVAKESLDRNWVPWFQNANDYSIEGIRHVSLPWRSVQFHPEAAGGPRDTAWILEDFIRQVRSNAQGEAR